MPTNLIHPKTDYSREEINELNTRYNGFGERFYAEIKEHLPEVYKNLIFYRKIKNQPEDSYAEYINSSKSFAIQLDPLCEVIVLWNNEKQIEIGFWAKNEYNDAIDYIKKEFL